MRVKNRKVVFVVLDQPFGTKPSKNNEVFIEISNSKSYVVTFKSNARVISKETKSKLFITKKVTDINCKVVKVLR